MKAHAYYKWFFVLGVIAISILWLVFLNGQARTDQASLSRLEKLREVQERDRLRLNSYGWVDRAKGWIRIPIDRAMELEERRLRSIPPCLADRSTVLVELPP